MHLFALPNELLAAIFDFLSRRDLCRCNLVNRRWSMVATRILWQRVSFRLHPYNNPLADLLHEEPSSLRYFTLTTELEFDLVVDSVMDYHGEAWRKLGSDILKNFDLVDQICANIPPRLSLLKLKFDRLAGHKQFFRRFESVLVKLASLSVDETRIDCTREPYDISPSATITPLVFAFSNSLTRLRTDFSWLMSLPEMPHLTHCEVQYDFHYDYHRSDTNDWWHNLFVCPLRTLHLISIHIPTNINITNTITTLSLVEMPDIWAALRLAFFTLPNLRVLLLAELGIDSAGEMEPEGPFSTMRQWSVVSTKLSMFVLGPSVFPAWMFCRIRDSCIELKTILFIESKEFPAVALDGPIVDHFMLSHQHSSFPVGEYPDINGGEGYLESFFVGREELTFLGCKLVEFGSGRHGYRLEKMEAFTDASTWVAEISTDSGLGERRIRMNSCQKYADSYTDASDRYRVGSNLWSLFSVQKDSNCSEGWEYQVSNLVNRYHRVST
jgi:hypothetical protein